MPQIGQSPHVAPTHSSKYSQANLSKLTSI